MRNQLDLTLSPPDALDEAVTLLVAAKALKIPPDRISHVEILKRSLDARSRHPKILLRVEVYVDEPKPTPHSFSRLLPDVKNSKRILVIGSGPAGLFAALKLIERGLKPIILERGKGIRERRRDIAVLNKELIVNPDSNYCFGEGGAGTFSDGKLYTRSDKRGNIRAVLETFVEHGAARDILIEAHPHIGTNKLPEIISSIRERILALGGEVHFDTRLAELLLDRNRLKGVVDQHGVRHEASAVILATGHSARDVFSLLDRNKIKIESKQFALGVRVEHPQALIDEMQYKCHPRGPYLPPASYSFVEQIDGRGVYSFCMCPGGVIAPCATHQDEIVTNGWSPSKRNNPFANSGVVVSVQPGDLIQFQKYGSLAGMHFQRSTEHLAWRFGGKTQVAPAQRMEDLIQRRLSTSLPRNSYQPGCTSVELREVLPPAILGRLSKALVAFGKKRKGYLTNEAIVVAVESRTSSPVRIPRDPERLAHPEISGLYPCGEGAGYAGGIISAAIDGERCAEACAREHH